MSRRPSPRPTFDAPTSIRAQDATMHLWGDEASGWVSDRIFVSTEQVHQLELSIPSGGRFQHSENNRTFFAADEVFIVLDGVLALANPATGEVQRVEPGEAVFFRRDTWHHGFSVGERPLRVLEYFCPPPAQGTSSSYAMQHDNLTAWSYTHDESLGHWPMEAEEITARQSMRVLRSADRLWRMEGGGPSALVGLFVSTEHMTVGTLSLLSGQRSGHRVHPGQTALYVIEGELHVFTPDDGPPSWFELRAGDGFFVPEGRPYELYNMSGDWMEAAFVVAPDYVDES